MSQTTFEKALDEKEQKSPTGRKKLHASDARGLETFKRMRSSNPEDIRRKKGTSLLITKDESSDKEST